MDLRTVRAMFSLDCHIVVIIFVDKQTCFVPVVDGLAAHFDDDCEGSVTAVYIFTAYDYVIGCLGCPESLSHCFDGNAVTADTVAAVAWIFHGQIFCKHFHCCHGSGALICHRKGHRICLEFTSADQLISCHGCCSLFQTCHMTGAIHTYNFRIAADIDHFACRLCATADAYAFVFTDLHFTVLHIRDIDSACHTFIINIIRNIYVAASVESKCIDICTFHS